MLASRGCALRVRAEGGRAVLTFKGPVRPGPVKIREEIETGADSAETLLAILERVAFHPAFRYEKYREEFAVPGAVVAIDETPLGTFIEIEGEEPAIAACAAALGFSPADYVTASYYALFVAEGRRGDMTFASSARA